ncbi:MAG: GNAT family N-acetyltransferase [Proteobacteria bacterium]|nr:GNAT family N-acetyltransferase [Pseudomonadota bacterium]
MSFSWRGLTATDLDAVARIAAMVHPAFPEDDAVFAERLALHPAGCRLLIVAGEPAGYAISHPWRLGTLPALNALVGALPAEADTYYIHDLALLPAARGTGAAGALVQDLKRHVLALGLPALSLVAVNDSGAFWRRQGFAEMPAGVAAEKLASYGDDARLMTCPL